MDELSGVTARGIARISETVRQAFLRRELTPFHDTDQDIERNQRALHYPIRSDADRMGQEVGSTDPLTNGIVISPQPSMTPQLTDSTPKPKVLAPREQRNRWRLDDGKMNGLPKEPRKYLSLQITSYSISVLPP